MHYIQYERDEIQGETGTDSNDFRVWTHKTRPKIQKGDRVWLLKRKAAGQGSRYFLRYYFLVDLVRPAESGPSLITGKRGRFLGETLPLRQEPWFQHFFERYLGRGSFGFVAVPSEYQDQFDTFEHRLPVVTASSSSTHPAGKLLRAGMEERVWRSILERRGQADFREQLLRAYSHRCCMTGCSAVDVLEAAHIVPHAAGGAVSLANGLLLRADIHTLFDLDLIGVDAWGKIRVSRRVTDKAYRDLDGRLLAIPHGGNAAQPDRVSLAERLERLRAKERE